MAIDEEKKTEEAAPAPSSEGKSSIVKWAIVGAILLLFVGVEVGIAVFFVGKLKEPDAAAISAEVAAKARQDSINKQTSMGATLAAPIEITVNISGEDGRYLKCGVQLEYDAADEQLGLELEARKARMKDIIIDIMSSKSLSDLMSNDGKKAIREQIVAEVNNTLPEEVGGKPLGKVSRSYFDSFVMQ
jgi:flagellar protein FliL